MSNHDWSRQTLRPPRTEPPKVDIRYPCPGLCRLSGTAAFMLVGYGTYHVGRGLLGIEPMDWAQPSWTPLHVGLVIAASVVAMIAGLIGFGSAMMVEVESEPVSDAIIIFWQFLANGSLVWVLVIGTVMSLALGSEEARAAVTQFGAERATLHAIGTGAFVAVAMGVGYAFGPALGVPGPMYLLFAIGVASFAARWHLGAYGIEAMWWIGVGVVVPLLVLLFTPAMIERDRDQRRLAIEMTHES